MNGYEKLLKIMQEEGMKNNPAKIVIGIMKSPTECEVAKNILDMVAVYRLSDEKYLILDKVVNVDVSI